jgi:undecaprenyl-diphosphatase
VSAACFVLAWDSVSERGSTVHADHWLVEFAVRHRTSQLTSVARLLTRVGSAWVVVPVVILACAILAIRRRFLLGALLVASTALTASAVLLVKELVARPRPPTSERLVVAVGKAFPSGHAAQSVACYAALAWIVTRTTTSRVTRIASWCLATAFALGIGWSRVYFAVHWPSDVVGGWALAAAVLAALIFGDLIATERQALTRGPRGKRDGGRDDEENPLSTT